MSLFVLCHLLLILTRIGSKIEIFRICPCKQEDVRHQVMVVILNDSKHVQIG